MTDLWHGNTGRYLKAWPQFKTDDMLVSSDLFQFMSAASG